MNKRMLDVTISFLIHKLVDMQLVNDLFFYWVVEMPIEITANIKCTQKKPDVFILRTHFLRH